MTSFYDIARNLIRIPSTCRMIEVGGATAIGSNQVTQVISPGLNLNGMILLSFYTQVIQTGSPGNLAQSLVVSAETAPTDFTSKIRCFPIYRTFQSDKQTPIALGGFAPMNVTAIEIPAHWGVWQVANVVGATLDRNNMRLGIVFL